jgi:hypothetical protein
MTMPSGAEAYVRVVVEVLPDRGEIQDEKIRGIFHAQPP